MDPGNERSAHAPRGWWRQPLRYRTGFRHGLLPAAAAGGAVFFILATYQPFGTYEARIDGKYWLLAGYGVVAALLVLAVHAFAPLMRRAIRIDGRWTWTHMLLSWALLLAFAAPAEYAYYSWAFGTTFTLTGLRHFYVLTLAVAVAPMAVLVLHAWWRAPTPAADTPAAMPAAPTPAPPLVLLGDNRDDRLELDAARLLYVKAADNYSEVVFLDAGGVPQRRLLRTTLSALQQQIDADVVRVHRSYLVNPANVQQCSGNAQGLQLQLRGTDERVPVSRAYVAAVRERIGQPPQ